MLYIKKIIYALKSFEFYTHLFYVGYKGPVQSTNFGEGACVVTNNLEFKDSAYTNLSLKAHTDSVFLKNPPRFEIKN